MARKPMGICIHWEKDMGAGEQFDKVWKISPREMNVKRFKVLGWCMSRLELGYNDAIGSAIEVYFGKNQDGKGPFLDAVQFGERFIGGGGIVITGNTSAVTFNTNVVLPEPVPFDTDDVLYIFTTWINKRSDTQRFEMHLVVWLEVED